MLLNNFFPRNGVCSLQDALQGALSLQGFHVRIVGKVTLTHCPGSPCQGFCKDQAENCHTGVAEALWEIYLTRQRKSDFYI